MLIPQTVIQNAKGGGQTYLIAANDAPAAVKLRADYVCDGVSDEVEINAVLSAMPRNVSGAYEVAGAVRLSQGTFLIRAPIVCQLDQVSFRGAGYGATIIKRDATWSGAQMIEVDRDDLATDRCAVYVDMGDFAVVGSDAGTPGTMDGILFRASNSVLSNVRAQGCNGWGIRVKGYASWTTYSTLIDKAYAMYNGYGGVYFDDSSTDAGITNSHCAENAGPGIQSDSITSWITNCYLFCNHDNPTDPIAKPGAGIFVPDSMFGGRMVVVGNKIEQNRGGVVFRSGGSFLIADNIINSNSYAANYPSGGSMPTYWYSGRSSTVATQGALSGTGTGTFVITSAANFPTGWAFKVKIDNEIMAISSVSGTTFTISARGTDGTTAASHAGGATVYLGREATLGSASDIMLTSAAGGSPWGTQITGNFIEAAVYASDQSQYALQASSGDQFHWHGNQVAGTYATANFSVGSSGHFDFKSLSTFYSHGTITTSLTPDLLTVSGGELNLVTLGAATVTVNAPNFSRVGMTIRFIFTQDGTGGRIIAWDAIYDVGSWKPRLDPNQTSEISFVYNGTNWVASEDSPKILAGTTTWDPGSLANSVSETTTVTVTGARVGDPAMAALTTIPAGATAGKWMLAANVTSNNTVTVVLWNAGAGTVNLGSGTLNVVVAKR